MGSESHAAGLKARRYRARPGRAASIRRPARESSQLQTSDTVRKNGGHGDLVDDSGRGPGPAFRWERAAARRYARVARANCTETARCPRSLASTGTTLAKVHLENRGGAVMRVLRVVASEQLPCGCLVGVYETYRGGIAKIVDDRACGCWLGHRVGQAVESDRRVGRPAAADQPPADHTAHAR